MKIRSKLIAAVSAYLSENYSGPISIEKETDDGDLMPPYAVVRISTAVPLAPGEPIWEALVLLAVSHDADATAASIAESQADELFAALDDEDAFASFAIDRGVVVSAFFPEDSQASTEERRWTHILGMKAIVAEAD